MNNAQHKTTPDIVIQWLGGNCPVQSKGFINDKPFYFRARGDSWRMNIGGADIVEAPHWSYEEDYGDGPFDAGWMTEDEARSFIEKSARLFASGNPTDGYRMFENG